MQRRYEKNQNAALSLQYGSLIRTVYLCVFALIYVSNSCFQVRAQQQQDPMTMNGGSVLAMAGKDSVAVAVDKRFASANTLINVVPRKVLTFPRTIVAFTGFESDVQSLSVNLEAIVKQRKLPLISARAMSSLTSHVLYGRRQSPYYVEPLVVGLELVESAIDDSDTASPITIKEGHAAAATYRPYLCSLDVIGAKSESTAFVCAGAASDSLFGTAEALWRPELSADELRDVCTQAFLSALERDCFSGYGAFVYTITADGTKVYDIDSRTD